MRSETNAPSPMHDGVLIDAAVRIGENVLAPRSLIEARRGQILGLSGPSGCGKTTLLHLLVGDLPAGASIEGTVVVHGANPFDLRGSALQDFRRTQVAYVGQDPGAELNPVMTVRGLLRELDRSSDAARALEDVGLDPAFASRRIRQLSGGQQRRVSLARALVRRPRVLVLDEPFSGLDAATSRSIATLLRRAADDGVTILLTGHDGALLDEVCDRRVHLGEAEPVLPVPRHPDKGEGTGTTVLAVRALSVRSLSGQPLVEDLDLDLRAGTITALLGASGSGKSTLLSVLQGRHPSAAGTITLDGAQRPFRPRRSKASRRAIQLVPQDPLSTLNPTLTALAAVARAARHHPGSQRRHDTIRRAGELLLEVGIGPDLQTRRPEHLSGGQRQRVAIARAIAPGPSVLLCDEVTSALDADTATDVMTALQHVASLGTPIVFATHDEALAESCCTSSVRL